MADGRHFENSFISISQLQIIRFLIKFGMHMQISISRRDFDKKIEILQIQDGGRTPY